MCPLSRGVRGDWLRSRPAGGNQALWAGGPCAGKWPELLHAGRDHAGLQGRSLKLPEGPAPLGCLCSRELSKGVFKNCYFPLTQRYVLIIGRLQIRKTSPRFNAQR